jgi:hypothetical protein
MEKKLVGKMSVGTRAVFVSWLTVLVIAVALGLAMRFAIGEPLQPVCPI